MFRRASLVAATLLSACRFDASVDPRITLVDCTGNGQCPMNYVCKTLAQGNQKVCVLDGAWDIGLPIGLDHPYGPGQVISFRFDFDGGDMPPTRGRAFAQKGPLNLSLGDMVDVEHHTFSHRLDESEADAPSGEWLVQAELRDDQGHVGLSIPQSLTIDREPPRRVNAAAVVLEADPQSFAAQLFIKPTAVGVGTEVTVTFNTSEELEATDSGIVTRVGDAPYPELAFAPAGSGSLQIYRAKLASPDAGELDAVLELTLTDRAGNSGTEVLPVRLHLDTVPPQYVGGDGGLVLQRFPWGTETDAGALSQVVAERGVSSEEGTVLVFSDDELLGRRNVVPAATKVVVPVLVATPRLDVVAVDRAGNPSLRERVRDVELVMNPNGVDSTDVLRAFEERPAHVEAREVGRPRPGIWNTGGTSLSSSGRWRSLPSRPQGGHSVVLAFDSDRGIVVSHGVGILGSLGPTAWSTLEWSGQGWADADNAGLKLGADDLGLAYDPIQRSTVLVNGPAGRIQRLADGLWNDATGGRAAMGRSQFGTAFDPHSGTVVVYGGIDGGVLSEVVAWSGQGYTVLNPQGPQARRRPALTWDASRGRLVMAGGIGSANQQLKDSWSLDTSLATWRWQQGTDLPAGSERPMLVFDSAADRVRAIVPNGTGPTWSNPLASVYELDPATGGWRAITNLDVTHDGGPAAAWSAVYDATRAETVVGFKGHQWLIGTDGGVRTRSNAVLLPPPQATEAGLAYDAASGQFVLFGGRGDTALVPPVVWCWTDRGGWQREAGGAGMVPQAREGHSLSPLSQGLLLHGGRPFGDTWKLSPGAGCMSSWSQLSASTANARPGHAATAFDGGVLFLGGDEDGGLIWSDVQNAFTTQNAPQGGPDSTVGARAAVTWTGTQLVATGGMYTYTAPFGMRFSETRNLGGRRNHVMVFDQGIGLPLVFGNDLGARGVGTTDELLIAYTQAPTPSWSPVTLINYERADPPNSAENSAMAYDPVNERSMLYGGSFDSPPTNETWELRIAGQHPAVVFHAELGVALLLVDPKTVVFTGVSAQARAGASTRQNGVDLAPWYEGRWQLPGGLPSPSNTAPFSTPASLGFQVDDPRQVARMLEGQHRLSVAIAGRGGHALTAAVLQVSWLEVRLRYRLP